MSVPCYDSMCPLSETQTVGSRPSQQCPDLSVGCCRLLMYISTSLTTAQPAHSNSHPAHMTALSSSLAPSRPTGGEPKECLGHSTFSSEAVASSAK